MNTGLLALMLLCAAARTEDGEPPDIPQGRTVESDDAAALSEASRRLADDPGLREALVERILKSKFAGAISKEADQNKMRSDVRDWVEGDLDSAAAVAIGLDKDDARGDHAFENSSMKIYHQTFRRNPNAEKGAYGVLKSAARKSKGIDKVEQDVSEEQRREMLRNLFEGKGAQGESVVTGEAPAGKPAAEQEPTTSLAGSFYDRLSAGNIRGYSPQLLTLQNALNNHRPPGAPRLIETGKLDFATLSYPAFGLRYDLGNLEERLRRERVARLADLAGVRLTARDMQDRDIEARLLGKIPSDKLPKRLAARSALLDKAKAAAAAFEAEAAKSKTPNLISQALLVELAGRQREAARWITASALEEDLGRLETEENFLDAELLSQIDAVPAPAPLREGYKRRGERHKIRLSLLKANTRKVLDELKSDAWLSRLSAIEKILSENQPLRRNLSRDISDYRLVPYRIAQSRLRQARWRSLLDDLLITYASKTSYGRAVAARRGNLSRFLGIFDQIASGDLEAAHMSLVNAEGGRH